MSTDVLHGYDVIRLDEVDSTMAEVLRRAHALSGPTWVMARTQLAPHGRRGRPWSSPRGNFSATLFMRPNCDPATAALRSFVASVALYYTLASYIDARKLALKWPNDVLLRSRKVAGILLESGGSGAQVDWLSIGIGVNLIEAPKAHDLEDRAVVPVSLAGAGGATVSPDDFLDTLAAQYAQWEQQFCDYGFEPIRMMWLRYAAKLGDVITARTTRDTVVGTFETVDDEGNLVLRTDAGARAIPAADVYF